MLKYKGYVGHVEFDGDADIFHGVIVGIHDEITFQGNSVDEIHQAMKDSVEDYLDMCRKYAKEPEKPFSGKLIVRLNSELHRKVACAALREKESINKWITKTLEEKARR